MADTDNTEELRLNTTQAQRSMELLLTKAQQFQRELKSIEELSKRLAPLQRFSQSAGPTSSSNRLSNLQLNPRPERSGSITTSTPVTRNIETAATALKRFEFATRGPASSIDALSRALGQFSNFVTSTATRLRNAAASMNSGGSGGGAAPPRAGYGPAGATGGRPSYGGTVIRRVLAYGVAGAEVGAVLGAVREVVQLDNALKNLQAITRSSDGSMAVLRGRILDVATASKFMGTEVAGAAVTLGQAGLSANQIGAALKSVVNLAAASGSDLQNAVSIITSAMGAFNLNASEAGDVANLFTAALNQSKLSMDQLTQGFTYSANAASQLGVSYEELTALLASLSNAGIKSGSTLGTNLRALFIDLTDPSQKLVTTLARLGVSLDDVDTRTKSFTGILHTLKDAGFTASDAFQTLETRSAAAYVALSGQLDGLGELQRGLIATSAASDAAAVQMESLTNTALQFASVITSIASTAFQPMIDGLQQVLAGSNGVLKSFMSWKEALGAAGTFIAAMAGRSGLGAGLRLFGATAAAGAVGGTVGFAGAVAISALVLALGQAKNKMDQLTAAVEDAKGKNEAAKTSYQEVEKAITDLLAKEQSLRKNKDDLKTVTVQLGERFRALGLDVNGLEGDFDGLLTKLKLLDTTQRSALQGSLDLLSATQGQEIAGLKATSPGVTNKIRNSVFGSGSFDTGEGVVSLPVEKYSSGARTNFGAVKPGSAIDKFLLRLSSGQPLSADDFTLVQSAKTQAANENVNVGLASAIDQAYSFTGSLQTKEAVQKATQTSQASVAALNNPEFLGLEEGASSLYRRLQPLLPKRIGDDPVGTEGALAGFINKYGKDIQGVQDAYGKYAGDDAARKSAVGQSSALQQLLGLRDQAVGEREGVRDEAKKYRAQLAGLNADALEDQLNLLEKELQRTETPDELKAVGGKISTILPELFKAQVSEFLQGLGFSPDEFSSNGNTFSASVGGRATPVQRKQLQAFVTKFKNGPLAGANDQTNAQADRLAKDFLKDQLDTLKLSQNALDRKIRDAFKNIDQYTPQGVIEKIAGETMKDLVEWYAGAIETLKTQNKLEKLTPAQYQDRLDSINSERDSRQDEITGRIKTEKYNYGRQVGDDKYANIRTALSLPVQTDFANTFSESMIAAIENVRSSWGGLLSDIETGQKSIVQGAKEMAKGILSAMLNVINSKIAEQFLKVFLKFLPGPGGAGAVNGGVMQLSSTEGLVGGGLVGRRFAGGGSNRDSVLAALTPGEMVIRKAAVEAIGRDNLEQLNSMGNSRRARGAVPQYQKPEPAVTNVYVVHPQRPPQLGKNDILVTVAEDILQGGSTKRLIKSVAAGM